MWSVTFVSHPLLCLKFRLPFLRQSQLQIERRSRGRRCSREDLVDVFVGLSCFVIWKQATTIIVKLPQRKLLAPIFPKHSTAFAMSSEVTDTNSHFEKAFFTNYISN